MIHSAEQSLKLQYKRAAQGGLIALTLPLAGVMIQWLQGNVSPPLTLLGGPYPYLFIFTLLAFASFGWYVGYNEEKSKAQSLTDPLTQCFNSRYFHQRFEQELQRATRSEQSLSVMILDIDKFKGVNDNFGHPAGDKVLVDTCRTISENLRSYEILCRVGGEEFAILTLQSALPAALDIAHRIKSKIKSKLIVLNEQKQLSITVSIGVSSYRLGDSIDSMIARADKALYEAKNNGRDCVMSDLIEPCMQLVRG
ncbi:MAG: diguanylate cyclase (GGDEF)-like protein [Paraglaciecola sp.]|jgi:diguanylate cyclase (GGDEF)-like protein